MSAAEVPLLSVRGVSIAFGGPRAVDEVSFDVGPGTVYGVIGPNGAGKTTLLNGISGVLPLATGEVWFDGIRVDALRAHRIADLGIARTFQAVEVFNDFTVTDYLMVGRLRFQDTSIIGSAFHLPRTRRSEQQERDLARARLAGVGLEASASAPLNALSYGQRKLIDILRARHSDPKLLLLDEPTSGTASDDRAQLREVLAESRAAGVTTVVVDHDVRFVNDVCDRIVVITSGRRIAEGEPEEVLGRDDVIKAYIGG